ncbi:DUF1992 domain-containing protein TDEL_0E05280 [Torulaspora delbrueckii]|uniref:DnaJ homologue subfamily C member 28 conserved domain-containing protein n=1 Tax=Torulaspora delbrueckii TaxID=4950 RepID=G8ZVX7_TORDE|nr:hypothetical protein TDEL_0E05280 [Torulaspora delbrueckii]CCE92771.1 hypothetical protein TDEL_0E05280 [Torulaspora delbrueckii]
MRRVLTLRYRYGRSRLYSSKDDEGYMARRLEDLKEQNTIDEDDPLVKLSKTERLVDMDTRLSELHRSLPQKSFENNHKNQLQYAKVQVHVNRQSKDIALSKPWGGDEDPRDTSLRMLVDSVAKPLNRSARVQGNLGFTKVVDQLSEPRKVRASRRMRRKLEDAQDNVLKYQRDKGQDSDKSEQLEFRTLYAEKFTPLGSFEKLRSLADQRIEESRKHGAFDNLENLRGKPVEMPRLNQHVDRTEHYLNNMLIRQKITPPWIESQGRVNEDLNNFRKEAKSGFENELISHLKKSRIYLTGANIESIKKSIKERYGSPEDFVLSRFSCWKSAQFAYFQTKTKTLNNNLRSYNLQAPLSTQKLYLLPDKEFKRVFDSINLDNLITTELSRDVKRESEPVAGSTSQSVFSWRGIFGIGR